MEASALLIALYGVLAGGVYIFRYSVMGKPCLNMKSIRT